MEDYIVKKNCIKPTLSWLLETPFGSLGSHASRLLMSQRVQSRRAFDVHQRKEGISPVIHGVCASKMSEGLSLCMMLAALCFCTCCASTEQAQAGLWGKAPFTHKTCAPPLQSSGTSRSLAAHLCRAQ